MHRRSRRTLKATGGAAALLAGLLLPVAASPQAKSTDPPGYARAVQHLEAGDTLGGLAMLRTLVREEPRFGPGWLELGAVLSARAGTREDYSRERAEAERALEQARRLMPDDPRPLLELGLLFRKQHMLTDARRVLERVWDLAEASDVEMDPDEGAQLHYTLGRLFEIWWEDWHDLVMIPPSAERVHCGELWGPQPHTVASVVCARAWARQYEGVVPLADLRGEEWTQMVRHYRRALELDPGHVEAAVNLLGHLADAGMWEEYEARARLLVEHAPDDPRSHLFLGLGLHERGRDDEAGRAFYRGLSLMRPEERGAFQDIEPLIPRRVRERYQNLSVEGREATANLLFEGKDPLYLTDAQERRLEHYARVAWADLKFSSLDREYRGWETHRGNIWIRYGPPWRSYQCCYGSARRDHYWSYGPSGPLFVFGRQRTSRVAYMNETSAAQAEDLEELGPELYRPRSVTETFLMPHQGVRFKGDEGNLTRLELYAAPPLDSILAVAGAPVQAGVFVRTPDLLPVWEHQDTLLVSDAGLALTYRVQLPPGRYYYGLEARLDGPDNMARPVARSRRDLTTTGYPADRLALSDLLLARQVRPLVEQPTRREELAIDPVRGWEVVEGEPLALYFEAYGLEPDDEGLVRYGAELTVEDTEDRGVLARILGGAANVLGIGEDEDTRITWERHAHMEGDRVIDWLTLELPDLQPGQYTVKIRVTDPVGGGTVSAFRPFQIRLR